MLRKIIDLTGMEAYEAGATLFAHLVSKLDATHEDIDRDRSILAHYALKQTQLLEPSAAESINFLPKFAFYDAPRMEGRLKEILQKSIRRWLWRISRPCFCGSITVRRLRQFLGKGMSA